MIAEGVRGLAARTVSITVITNAPSWTEPTRGVGGRMTDNDESPQDLPTPGSPEATALGCRCAPERNNHGKHPPFTPGTHIGGSTGGWLIAGDCTLHATSTYRGAIVGRAHWREPSVE